MRLFFTTVLLSFLSSAYASNDTLIRAEIYNWSVGDTFDYREYSYAIDYTGYSETHISFSRYVVSNISWSSDSSSKTINETEIFPYPGDSETVQLDSLNAFEVILDTVSYYPGVGPSFDQYYQIDSLPEYFGRETNFIYYFLGGVFVPEWQAILFGKGLGKVINVQVGGGGYLNFETDTIRLIYYSGHLGTYGIPYYSYPTAITNIPISNEKIIVFPTLSNGKFTVEPPDNAPLPINFVMYDLQGRLLHQFVLNQRKNEIDLTGLTKGMYIWKSTATEGAEQAGRVVIQ